VLDGDRRQDIDIEQVLRLHRDGCLPCSAPSDGTTAET
jgi:hypothetical protein